MRTTILALLLATTSAADCTQPDKIFANGFELAVVPTNCISLASHTTGIRDFERWTGTQAVNYTSGPTPRQVDVTSFAAVFQFTTPWPGISGIAPIIPIPTNRYVSLQFTVPADIDTDLLGTLAVGQTGYSAPISGSVSLS